ncbi:hypothetical protein MMA231_03078 [Asticcacaulis sp. MM231]|uniref:LacI family DNA-binding transcriptional regulator n=1 Tax=Asticcacaulis sp. MM231 TaxID=3157666 RepID=UPI0032D5AF79
MKNLTIIDIAREAEVSIKTVSRVLNHENGVGADTRARVQAIIEFAWLQAECGGALLAWLAQLSGRADDLQ